MTLMLIEFHSTPQPRRSPSEVSLRWRRWARGIYRQQQKLAASFASGVKSADPRPAFLPRTLSDLLRGESGAGLRTSRYRYVSLGRHKRPKDLWWADPPWGGGKVSASLGGFEDETAAALALLRAYAERWPVGTEKGTTDAS